MMGVVQSRQQRALVFFYLGDLSLGLPGLHLPSYIKYPQTRFTNLLDLSYLFSGINFIWVWNHKVEERES